MTATTIRRPSLGERLRSRQAEIEQTILARVYSVSDPTEEGDPEYVTGLRAAVGAAVDYGLAGVECEAVPTTPIPSALFLQARYAARKRVSLDTVLRRYFAGYTLLGDFILREAEEGRRLEAEEIHRLSRAQAALFDGLVVAVTDEYVREAGGYQSSAGSERGRADRVKRLLDGELVDEAELDYEFGVWHLGAIATGPGASGAVRELAAALDRRLLAVCPDGGAVWVWLGGRSKVTAEEVAWLASSSWPEEVSLTIGEPAHGISGWRLTHRQAQATLPIALRRSQRIVRYADVALLASVLRDDVLCSSLEDIYLAPLAQERDGGVALRQTLRAYFAAAHHVTAAAARLGVSRQTVRSRLRTIEERIGRSLDTCAVEMETALRLRDLSSGQIR